MGCFIGQEKAGDVYLVHGDCRETQFEYPAPRLLQRVDEPAIHTPCLRHAPRETLGPQLDLLLVGVPCCPVAMVGVVLPAGTRTRDSPIDA